MSDYSKHRIFMMKLLCSIFGGISFVGENFSTQKFVIMKPAMYACTCVHGHSVWNILMHGYHIIESEKWRNACLFKGAANHPH